MRLMAPIATTLALMSALAALSKGILNPMTTCGPNRVNEDAGPCVQIVDGLASGFLTRTKFDIRVVSPDAPGGRSTPRRCARR